MQIKPHRNTRDDSMTWYLIRWTFDADKGSSKPTRLGIVREYEIRALDSAEKHSAWKNLSPDEQEHLRQHWKAAREPLQMQAHRRAVKTLVSRVSDVRRAINSGALSLSEKQSLQRLLSTILEDLQRQNDNSSEPSPDMDEKNTQLAA